MQPIIDQASTAVIVSIAAVEVLAQNFTKKPVIRLGPDKTDPSGKHLVFKECDCVHDGDNVCAQHNGITVAADPDVSDVRIDVSDGKLFFQYA